MSVLNFPVMQFHSLSSCLSLGTREEISSLEEGVDCHEVAPQPSLLQSEQTKRPQPLLGSVALEAFHHLGHPPLHTLW